MPLARNAMYEGGAQILAAPTWDKSPNWLISMQHIARDEYTQQVPAEYADTLPYLKGGFETEKGFWAWFSLYELARDPRFLNVAS